MSTRPMDATMHMRLVGKLPSGDATATIYRRSDKHAFEPVAIIIIQDPAASPETVADALCEAMDLELAGRRVN